MRIFSADFETTTSAEDCRVWAYAFCDIEEPEEVEFGTDISEFIKKAHSIGGLFYFHNLKFDGNFIVYYLLTHGYSHIYTGHTKIRLKPGEFTTVISDMGIWYSLKVCTLPDENGVVNTIEYRDSYKLIPLSVEDIPRAYGLEENKLSINYTEYRGKDHELTIEEKEYIKADVVIVAKAIKFMRDNGQTKMTCASNALFDFKNRFDAKEFKRLFPDINSIVDRDIRRSYKGGWTYLNPHYKNLTVGEGRVYDVNSMYPWAMKCCMLPYGEPMYFSGRYNTNNIYPLYIQSLICEFKLKPCKYPSIQLKNKGYYADNEYIEHSLQPEELVLTNVDLDLLFENYDVDVYDWGGGFMFKGATGIFADYVDYWFFVKTESKRNNNPGMEFIAKRMLNSLYGKFGARIIGKSKIPWYDSQSDIVRYKETEPEERKGVYIPVATFITSYCRDKIIRCANLCGDRFCYADTDSVHIIGNEPVEGIDIDEYRLGAFKLEEKFIRAKFIRQKTYLEVYNKDGVEKYNLKCCGMPNKMKESISEDQFYEGAEYSPDKFAPKLVPKVVPGGVILKETSFKIKGQSTMEKPVII